MWGRSPKVIQFEFHPRVQGSLASAYWAAVERAIGDGIRAKTVVRMPVSGRLLRLVAKTYRAASEEALLLERAAADLAHVKCLITAQKKLRKLKGTLRTRGTQAIRAHLLARKEMAFEPSSLEPFRPLRGDERHEILECISASSGAWIFVVETNDLYADGKILYSVF